MKDKTTLDSYLSFNKSVEVTTETMTEVLEMLDKCREAFNYLPRTELNEGDTYELASDLDKLFANLEK